MFGVQTIQFTVYALCYVRDSTLSNYQPHLDMKLLLQNMIEDGQANTYHIRPNTKQDTHVSVPVS